MEFKTFPIEAWLKAYKTSGKMKGFEPPGNFLRYKGACAVSTRYKGNGDHMRQVALARWKRDA